MVHVMLLINGKRKNPAAVALGRKGGKVKVPKGFAMMTPEQRSEIARKAVAARRKSGARRGQGTVICSACGQSVKVEIEPDDFFELLPIG